MARATRARSADAKAPLFRAAVGRTGRLGPAAVTRHDAYAMVRRRAIKAGVVEKIGNHSFRGTGITTYLHNDGSLELAQEMATTPPPARPSYTIGAATSSPKTP